MHESTVGYSELGINTDNYLIDIKLFIFGLLSLYRRQLFEIATTNAPSFKLIHLLFFDTLKVI
jgi:hypothetical protein